MIMSDETLTREILQRLTRIEENTKGINEATKTANEALSLATSNEKQIKDIKSSNRWSWGFLIVFGLTFIGNILIKFLGGN